MKPFESLMRPIQLCDGLHKKKHHHVFSLRKSFRAQETSVTSPRRKTLESSKQNLMEIPESDSDHHSTEHQKKSCLNKEFKWKTWVLFGQYPKFVPSCTYYISVSIYIYNDGFFGGHMGDCVFFGGGWIKMLLSSPWICIGMRFTPPSKVKNLEAKNVIILGGAASLNCALDRCPPLWEHDGKTNLRCWQVCQRATRNMFWVN